MVYNAEDTIADTIASVKAQDYQNLEHILIDGASTDNTMRIVNQHAAHFSHIVSEPDQGIYHAMNKGIELAGGDVIGILNSDDIYQDETVLTQVAETLGDVQYDACYADLVYVKHDDMTKVVRNWKSREYQTGLCWQGWMPAHPTLFLRSSVYQTVGTFNTRLHYQADLEFCARLFEIHKISSCYVPKLWVRMRMGGVTNGSINTILRGNWESYLALRKLGLKRNPLSYFFIKFSSRIVQYF